MIRPVACSLVLAVLFGAVPLAQAAPPATSLPLPTASTSSSAAPGGPPPSSLSGPLGAPLVAPQAAPQGAPQSAPASSSESTSSGTKQDSAAGQQSGGKSETLRASYDAAFQATLDHPSDPDVLVKFATLAVEYGDIEGAVSALERLLLIDDDQPEVKLELGVLYFRLGSKEAARMYLESARKSSLASPETKERAERYLKADGVN